MYNFALRQYYRLARRITIIKHNPRRFLVKLSLFSYLALFSYSIFRDQKKLYRRITITAQSLADRQIPVPFRSLIFGCYCRMYGVKVDQIEQPFSQYTNFTEFFTRKIIKRKLNPSQAKNAILCPADSKIISINEIQSDQNLIVKDIAYSLSRFLFNKDAVLDTQALNNLKSKQQNKLYQVIFYLGPGDYHRFHCPTSFKVLTGSNYEGNRYPVHMKSLRKRGGQVYESNARKILKVRNVGSQLPPYHMFLGLVGALNVSRIHINSERQYLQGDQLGYFSLGSTIVMVFEAKQVTNWHAKEGQKINYGEALCSIQ